MEAEIVLLDRAQRHRQAIFDLTAQDDRGHEVGTRRAGLLRYRQRGRRHDSDGMQHALGMMRFDVAGVAHRAVGEGGVDHAGLEAVADDAGLGLAPEVADEVRDQPACRDLRIRRGEQRTAAVEDHLKGANTHRRGHVAGLEARDIGGPGFRHRAERGRRRHDKPIPSWSIAPILACVPRCGPTPMIGL